MPIVPVNTGTRPNDGTGDSPSVAFGKTNDNATYLDLAKLDKVGDGSRLTGVTKPADLPAAVAAQAPNVSLPIGIGSSLPSPSLAKIARGQVPIFDMFDGAVRDGSTANEPLLNQMLSDFNGAEVLPSGQGRGPILAKNSPIIVPPNAKLRSVGGVQKAVITRLHGYTGDTMQMGSPTAGAGTAEVDGFWLLQPDRLLGAIPTSTTSLPGRITTAMTPVSTIVVPTSAASLATHLRVYGSQGGGFRGWATGMPSAVVQHGGDGFMLDLEYFGGVWDRLRPALQESFAVLTTIWDPVHGYPTKTRVVRPNWIGGNVSAELRAVPINNKTYSANERLGPYCGWWHAAGECCGVEAGFTGGFNHSNFLFYPGGPELVNGSPAWVQIRPKIHLSDIDESMEFGIRVHRSDTSQAVVNRPSFFGNDLHGQTIGQGGIEITAADGLYSVSRLKMVANRLCGYQGAGMRLLAVDGGEVISTDINGYNIAAFDTTQGDPIDYGVGALLGGTTRNVSVHGIRGGGGVNNDTDVNNCQWVFVDTTSGSTTPPNQGNTYRYVRPINLGLAPGVAVAAGTNDTGS
ncbi:hypothetical protein CIW48_27225 [Methylobacterium sp. P1-11]|uniref:hypothetical protein n=1 Tax=Methylobacterium sp. P1-11 TaxID=2024616 RepID=UPI0011EC536E|nr:hypothetical protein [Methylobacterium sp. P1-11]KAA0117895.1 hypothetical protein CIW48_27225 [Methylobacterium sp. P1-11]